MNVLIYLRTALFLFVTTMFMVRSGICVRLCISQFRPTKNFKSRYIYQCLIQSSQNGDHHAISNICKYEEANDARSAVTVRYMLAA